MLILQHNCVGYHPKKASRTSKMQQSRYRNTREFLYVLHLNYIFPSKDYVFSPRHIKINGSWLCNSYWDGKNESSFKHVTWSLQYKGMHVFRTKVHLL